MTDGTLQQHFNWLNQRALAEVPVPIKRDVETRAIERFFVEWTFYPSNHGTTPGEVQLSASELTEVIANTTNPRLYA